MRYQGAKLTPGHVSGRVDRYWVGAAVGHAHTDTYVKLLILKLQVISRREKYRNFLAFHPIEDVVGLFVLVSGFYVL